MAGGDLGRRVAVAAVGIPVVLAAIWVGGWFFGGLLALVAALAARELYGMAGARGVRPFAATGMTGAGALVVLATAFSTPAEAAAPMLGVLLALGLVTLAASVWLRWPGGEPLEAVAVTVFGALYAGGALAFAVFLRDLPRTAGVTPEPVAWRAAGFVLLPLLTTWAGDTAAYFGGRAWGRRKLFPAASPGKTVAGGVCGLVGAGAAGALVAGGVLAGLPALAVAPATGAVIGVLLGVAAQLGDVAESVLKREAGVKDSGRLLPGHGGVLDRFDSLLFTFPAAYGLLALFGVGP